MAERHDALVAASHVTIAVDEMVRGEPGAQVGTVGQLTVSPNVPNIVPGTVRLVVELRDLDAAKARAFGRARTRFGRIAQEENVELKCVPLSPAEPALTNAAIRNDIRAAAKAASYTTFDLPSGAGHDAQQIAHLAPIGMIFVPSRGGISHSPREYSSPDNVANGAEVLYRTVLLSDERLNQQR
jgi:N-carbamoyl-L-amino-acid hydrolase